MKRRTLALLAVVLAAVLVLALVLWWPDGGDDPIASAEPVGTEDVPTDLSRFYEQTLDWEDCDEAECTWVTVPIDYEEPEGETTRLRVAVHAATGDGERALVVNPGGPGGSSLDFAASMTSLLSDDVRDEYAVVGVDPRGVGESSPVDCLDDAELDAYIAEGSLPESAAEAEEYLADARRFGEGCAERTGELAGHVSTQEAARDLDVVRALLGQKKLDWFGASYGTTLGATYATLFPERVGTMVLDSATDPSETPVEGAMSQAVGFQRALESYLASCVEQESCPLGSDVDRGVQRLAQFLQILGEQPLRTDDPDRPLTQGRAFYGLAMPLYAEAGWPLLTQALTAAFQGDGSLLVRLSDIYSRRAADGRFLDNQAEAITAITCLDQPDGLTVEQAEDVVPGFEAASPVFGPFLAWGTVGCDGWPFPAEHPQVEIDASGAPPILVVGTTRDPATPYESAQALTEQLGEGVGVLLTREGDGHGAYTSGDPCIIDAVDAFLLDGTLPSGDARCTTG